MHVLDEIHEKSEQLHALARKHKAMALWVFGSCARKEERRDSDVDFLVRFSPESDGFAIVRLRRELASLFGREVDLVSEGCVRNRTHDWFSAHVLRERIPV